MTKYTVEAGSGWRATLDGKPALYAQEADDEAGYVLAPLVDAAGKPIFDFSRDNYAIVRREGKVEINGFGYRSPEELKVVAQDNPFHVKLARHGELSPDYAAPKSLGHRSAP
jgi:hypothetical protein